MGGGKRRRISNQNSLVFYNAISHSFKLIRLIQLLTPIILTSATPPGHISRTIAEYRLLDRFAERLKNK
jgi:hypothetical protein